MTSEMAIAKTISIINLISFIKLSLFLFFSEICCKSTFEIEVAISAKGIDKSNLDKFV